MKDGFVKVAAVTPKVKVADPEWNVHQMIERAEEMAAVGVRLLVFPELSVTGYTCGDLFLTDTLLKGAREALYEFLYQTAELDMVCVLGMPLEKGGSIYNTAVVVSGGRVLGVVPKSNLSNYEEFHELRCFSPGEGDMGDVLLGDDRAPFGTKLVFQDTWVPEFIFGVEVGSDLLGISQPSSVHCMAGALLVVNPSASSEYCDKSDYRRGLVVGQSGRCVCGYIYAEAGEGESSTDVVFAGHNIISENGHLLAEREPFSGCEPIISEIDLNRLRHVRRHFTVYPRGMDALVENYRKIVFDIGVPVETILTRDVPRFPFVPESEEERQRRAKEITNIQVAALKKRMEHLGCKDVVIGLSGGLDSTLTLLVATKTFDRMHLDRGGIHTVTMPGFGTTDRTHDNAVKLAKELATDFREIDICAAVRQHFSDIGQSEEEHDTTYENAQARERTQILMDLANRENAIVLGTGDLSELALGWATYNGDHMSMYDINASVPKTLVRSLVEYHAEKTEDSSLSAVLKSILETPVSPELLPSEDGEIAQKTEDIVGPYELHDFFLYHMMRTGAKPSKILRLACHAFRGVYDEETIEKWLDIFMKRFFSQQYKRSCLPDGPKVGSVGLSSKGDWMMPSDASDSLWRIHN
ncbi:MAG: NAD(+) synthase [Eubacterium sp.]|nr:NAD(+) synthase [Eubacterium sp.]